MIDNQSNYTIDDSLKTSTTVEREKKGLYLVVNRRAVVCKSPPVAARIASNSALRQVLPAL
jgi:hypothetical protein